MVNALVKYADHSRFEIFVGILSRDEGSLQSLVDMGAKPVQFDMKRFTDVSVIPALIRTLRDNRIQILHTHRTRPDLLGRIDGYVSPDTYQKRLQASRVEMKQVQVRPVRGE